MWIINNVNDVTLNTSKKIIISVEKNRKNNPAVFKGLMDYRILKSWKKNYLAMDLDQIIQLD